MESEITVVIPVHNRAQLVGETLQSVLMQSYRPLQVILVDNNSTDATLSVLQEWKRKNESETLSVEVLNESVRGASAARNTGLAHVATPWVMFFDSDDIMHPRHIENVLGCIRNNPEADLIGWDVEYVSEKRHKTERFHSSQTVWNSLFRGDMATQRWCARTDEVRKAGGWNQEISLWDDIELGMRLLARNPRIVKLEGEPQVQVRYTPQSITGSYNADYARRLEQSARHIAAHLPAHAQLWLACVLMREKALCRRAGASVADLDDLEGFARAIAPGCKNAMMLRFSYLFTLLGGRGLHHILKPFISHNQTKHNA